MVLWGLRSIVASGVTGAALCISFVCSSLYWERPEASSTCIDMSTNRNLNVTTRAMPM